MNADEWRRQATRLAGELKIALPEWYLNFGDRLAPFNEHIDLYEDPSAALQNNVDRRADESDWTIDGPWPPEMVVIGIDRDEGYPICIDTSKPHGPIAWYWHDDCEFEVRFQSPEELLRWLRE